MAPRLLIPTRFVESEDCDGGVDDCSLSVASNSLMFDVRLFVVDNVDVDTTPRSDVYDVGGGEKASVVVQS